MFFFFIKLIEIQNDFDIFDMQYEQLDDPLIDEELVIEEMYNRLQRLKEIDLISYRKIKNLL